MKTDTCFAVAVTIVRKLRRAGYDAYLVGGCVRDRLLGRIPKDCDVATQATPAQIATLFPDAKSIGAAFAVMEYKHVQIATFRTEGTYSDRRHPDAIKIATLAHDAMRRDFTINCLYEIPVSINPRRIGTITDLVGGQNDLRNRILRTVGDSKKRFREDALRLVRAVRFAAEFNLTIESDTLAAMTRCRRGLSKISRERVRDELLRILTGANPQQAVRLLEETSLLALLCDNRILTHCIKKKTDRLNRLCRILQSVTPDNACTVMLAALIAPENGKAFVAPEVVFGQLRLSNHRLRMIHLLLENLHALRHIRLDRFVSPHIVRRIAGNEYVRESLLLFRGMDGNNPTTDEIISMISVWLSDDRTPLPPPLITGNHLVEWGVTPHTVYADLLRYLYDLQLDGKLEHPEIAPQFVRHYLSRRR